MENIQSQASASASASVGSNVRNKVYTNVDVVQIKSTSRNPEIWSNYELCVMNDGVEKARCRRCGKFYNPTSNSTLRRHKNASCRAASQDVSQSTLGSDGVVFIYDNDALREDFTKFVIQEALPFNHFDNQRLTNIIKKRLQPRYQQVSRTTLRSDAFKLWKKAKKDIIDGFENSNYGVSITCDVWTAPHGTTNSYLAVTAHWFHPESWLLMKRTIAFKLFGYSHTGCNLRKILNDTLIEYKLDDKVFTISLDNASNNTRAMDLLKLRLKYIDKVKRLKFGEGDAEAIQGYFMKVQSTDREFFYAWELDEENRLKSLFWADARCRAAYEEFGNVVTFDTTYLTNEYEMPMAPFVGVNHHGQSILLGCGLISNEDIRTFTWLFRSWLTCMSGRAPNAIITDQDGAMKNAIEIVFPDARHRWCLWHIMKKIPEKLGKHKKYKSIKYKLKKVVYDSLTTGEFEAAWNNMIETYKLEKNKWLNDLYAEKQRWVPCFVKDIFWAGMSTTQRSESINSFFDKYVNKKTTLKQFVEQYENALRDRVEKVNIEDFNSYSSWYPPITRYAMEKQMKDVLTNAKFKEFREELTGKMYCGIGSIKSQDKYLEYEVIEDVMDNGNLMKKKFVVWFKRGDSVEECDIKCICRLFEFRGMLCRHALTVLTNENVYLVPNKYILRRWRKDVKRRHTKVKVNYSDWVDSDVGRRYDKMCHALADLACELDEKCNLVLDRVNELKSEIRGEKISISSPVCKPQISASNKDNVKICNPPAVRRKGRPPSKRLKSKSEKILTSIQKKKMNQQDFDHNELGCRAADNETMNKRSKKEKEGNQNDYYVPSDINHNGYTNFPIHYGGFIPSYTMQQPLYPSQNGHLFHHVSPQLQHVPVQMQQSSHIDSLNATFNAPNTTFSPPTTGFILHK